MPSTNGDLLRTGSRSDPERDHGMAKVMDSQRLEASVEPCIGAGRLCVVYAFWRSLGPVASLRYCNYIT
ncbi:hypothetical protein MCEKE4_00994 [Acidimicrobiia bacterium]